MIRGLIGRKLGMSQIFDKDGNVVPVTVIEAGPCPILEIKETPKKKVKLGFDPLKEANVNKPMKGFFSKAGVKATRIIKEFTSTENKDYKIGSEIKADIFKAGDFVNVTGVSIGKSFQGGMKLHNWRGGGRSHGSNHHRQVGSIGSSADPSRTRVGKTMPAHMGDNVVTTEGLRVIDVNVEDNYLLIKGAVPGARNGIVMINLSFKKAWKDLHAVKDEVAHKVNPMKASKAKAGAAKKK